MSGMVFFLVCIIRTLPTQYYLLAARTVFSSHVRAIGLSPLFVTGIAVLGLLQLCWPTTISGTKNLKKLVHLGLQFLALCLSLIGVWAALKFHNDKGIDNFYSLHSWLGVACISLFGIQWDDHHYMNSIMSKSKLARYILDQRLPMAEVLIDHDEEKCDRKSLLTLFGDVVVDPVELARNQGLTPPQAFKDLEFTFLLTAYECDKVFLPMIDNEHWYMVVMSLKEKR
ncbi:Transmembrane ascorbate ferrireductase 2 [Linum perenne]